MVQALPQRAQINLQHRIQMRIARPDDKASIARIWRANASELGAPQMASLNRSIAAGHCHVAQYDRVVVGFVQYHARRDGWQTIYHIAVDRAWRGHGIGRLLLFSVPCPMRLKVTVDNDRAIRFYEHLNMVHAGDDAARSGRALRVYELHTLFIQCAGNNRKFPALCAAAGVAYGSRHDDQIRGYPVMIDINWRSYRWRDYLRIVRRERPIMAMVPDYESSSQREHMLMMIRQLRAAGVLRVMVCPKFDGAIADIPRDCIVAVSVPTGYAGYLPPPRDLTGRNLHLLGGSPVKQRPLILQYAGIGAHVTSADGNSHTASYGQVWIDGRWQFSGGAKNRTTVWYEIARETLRACISELVAGGSLDS